MSVIQEITKRLPVIDALAGTPAAQKTLADQAAQLVADRQKLADRLLKADEALETEYSAHSVTVDKLKAAHDKAQQALNEARVAHHNAVIARSNAVNGLRTEMQQVEAELRKTANMAAIEEFRTWALDEMEALPKTLTAFVETVRHPITGRSSQKITSNAKSIARRMQAVNEALGLVLDGFPIRPDQRAIPALLQQLKADLPSLEEETITNA